MWLVSREIEEDAGTVQLTVLGSGSAGNATLVTHAGTGVLVDAGLSYKELGRRLQQIEFPLDRIAAVVVTHAHGDHTRGIRVFATRHPVPVYMTDAVYAEWGFDGLGVRGVLTAGQEQDIGGLRFLPMRIPHDASETVAFRIGTPVGAIGLVTDVGEITPALVTLFRGCRVLVVESNHATELLRMSPYDPMTRARIAGAHGHLSNEALAAFIRQHLDDSVRCIVLAHLSRVNNVPELAEMTCREALEARGRADVRIVVAWQHCVSPTLDLSEWDPVRSLEQTLLPFGPDAQRVVSDRRSATRP